MDACALLSAETRTGRSTPGRRVVPDDRLLSAAALRLSKHEIAAATLAPASPDGAPAAVAHRDSVAVLALADFCAVGREQQSRAAQDRAGARGMKILTQQGSPVRPRSKPPTGHRGFLRWRTRSGTPFWTMDFESVLTRWRPLRLARVRCERESVCVVRPLVLRSHQPNYYKL